jgi:hypothetical protein
MKSFGGTIAALRPEAELLVLSAQLNSSDEDADSARALVQSKCDWSYLLQAAQDHGVMPLLYRHLLSVRPSIPEEMLKRLHDEVVANTQSNLALTRELFELLDRFEAHEVRAIPYKGPALATSAYGDVAFRQFVDLDLIVHKRDVLRVKELLVTRGWQPEFELNGAQEAAFLDLYYDYGFRNEQGVLIEIHWELTEGYFNFPIDVERLWDRLVPVTIAGRRVMTLSPEDSLLIVCVHSSKHLWSRLGWISDVARLIESHCEMNWPAVIDHAARLGSKRMLSLGLFLAAELLGALVPEQVRKTLHSDSTVGALAADVVKRLFEERTNPPGILEGALLHLRMRERLRDRTRYLLRLGLMTTVGDLTAIRIPRRLFFLYYPLRPLRLAAKYGRRLLARVLQREGRR